MAGAEERSLLRDGDKVLLIDTKDRRYLLTLRSGTSFHTHAGIVVHDDLIGRPEGSPIAASTGRRFVAVRPTLSDLILKMPRGAQVIYPKDLGSILMEADIGPGMRVLEVGRRIGRPLHGAAPRRAQTWSATSCATTSPRALAATWRTCSGTTGRYRVEITNVYDGIAARDLDRILLDVPEPWRVLDHAAEALRSGGILCAYLPTINQTSELRYAIERSPFGLARTLEILQRTWHVEPRSVRPDHRMVGHTGFLTTARLLLREPEDPSNR